MSTEHQAKNNLKPISRKRNTGAQELASQDEKLLLMESSLKATQEQLTEQIAETVRQEQNSRKPQAELKTVTEGIIASEEEKNDYKGERKKKFFPVRKTTMN
ncbi:uncharacterized protein LOC144239969 isoform X2 [Crocuta crocuta]